MRTLKSPRRSPPPSDLPPLRRPADAYRADIARNSFAGSFGELDGQWIALASVLSRGPAESRMASPWVLVDELLVALVPSPRPHLDPRGSTSAGASPPVALRGPRVRIVAEEMENAGALELSDVVLAAYAQAEPEMTTLEFGRISAQRGRMRWKAGDVGAAHARYSETERLGKRDGISELVMRGWIGFAILARLRGNYPECRRWTERAIRLGERSEFTALTGLAHHVAMVSAAVALDFGAALAHGCAAFVAADGDPVAEGDTLVNLAQVMLDAGHPDTARAGFAAALERSTATRHLLPAFGGYALACAWTGDGDEVRRTVALVEALKESGSPYATASAYLECASALRLVGEGPTAVTLCARASQIADRYGFHEIAIAVQAQGRAHRPLLSATAFTEHQQEKCVAIVALANAHQSVGTGSSLAESRALV